MTILTLSADWQLSENLPFGAWQRCCEVFDVPFERRPLSQQEVADLLVERIGENINVRNVIVSWGEMVSEWGAEVSSTYFCSCEKMRHTGPVEGRIRTHVRTEECEQ